MNKLKIQKPHCPKDTNPHQKQKTKKQKPQGTKSTNPKEMAVKVSHRKPYPKVCNALHPYRMAELCCSDNTLYFCTVLAAWVAFSEIPQRSKYCNISKTKPFSSCSTATWLQLQKYQIGLFKGGSNKMNTFLTDFFVKENAKR